MEYLLLGPAGKFAVTELSDEQPTAELHEPIRRALGLRPGSELVLRRADGTPISGHRTLNSVRMRQERVTVVVDAREPARSRVSWRALAKRNPGGPAGRIERRPLPCYLVIDTSSSMQRDGSIGVVNRSIEELRRAMIIRPQIAATCPLSIITFDLDAKVQTGLVNFGSATFDPLAATVMGTCFSVAFDVLRSAILNDMHMLHLMEREPRRPAAFFLSDGNCENEEAAVWKQSLGTLAALPSPLAPWLVSFGFNDARQEEIWEIGRRAAYVQDGEPGGTVRLDEIMSFVLRSMTQSVYHRGGEDVLRLPDAPPTGWRQIRPGPRPANR